MSDTLQFALSYIRRGWSVFPLIPGTKQPAVKLGPYLTGAERMDEAAASRVWKHTQSQMPGIAVVTGKPSGIVVIDVDPRNGGDFEAVAKTIEDELRLCAATGGGGMHFVCAYPEGADHVPCGKTIMPGVDRKGDGGYIVVAPSLHPSGERYRWNECGLTWTETEPSTLPAWVTERPALQQNDAGEPTQPWVAATLANPQDCRPGAQEETLSRLCWWAARNLDPDIAEAVLGTWLARLPLGDVHHPWTLDDLQPKLARAYDKRPVDPGMAGPIVDDMPLPVGSFVPVSDLVFPEQEWIVEDFAAPGCFTEIIGKVKKGKSTLTYQLINAVRSGEAFIGRPTAGGPVVLLTEQTGTSLKKTLERAGLLGATNVYVVSKPALRTMGGWEKGVLAATAKCEEVGAKLIVVDTLSRLASIGGDLENSSGSVAVLDCFGRAKELGIASIFVRHARKGISGEADEIADAARGSSAITGDMDIVLRLTSVDDDTRCLSWESRITDDPEDVYLEYQDGTYTVVDKPEGKRESNEREDIERLRAAQAKLGDGATRNALAKEMGCGNSKVDRLLKKLKTYTHGPTTPPPLED